LSTGRIKFQIAVRLRRMRMFQVSSKFNALRLLPSLHLKLETPPTAEGGREPET
jgi:hypothetical protein